VRDFVTDVRYALRRLRGSPAFAATAILTLALGIGANTAIFSIVHGVLIRPLPFPEPDRLFAVYSTNRTADNVRGAVSPPDLDDWRARRQVIEDIGGYLYAEGSTGTDLTGRGAPRRLSVVTVTPGFFPALGVQAHRGRLPREDELVRGGADTFVLLTYGFWMREFGGEEVVGSTLQLGGRPHSVIGVLPPTLYYPAADADVFLAHSAIPDSAIPRIRPVRILRVVARARPGVTQAQVQAEMSAMTAGLSQEFQENRAWGAATVVPLAEVVTEPVQRGLLVLFGAVGLVLLMACVNVTSLQLARAAGRSQEIGVRLALGARRGRLIRQFLAESTVLAVLGGAVGVLLATLGVSALLALSAGQLPRAAEISLDTTAVLFSLGLSLLCGAAVGVAPALRSARGGTHGLLRSGGRTLAGSTHTRLRRGLVVAEIALALMLAVGAGLMARSFLSLLSVDTGFDPDRLLAVQFTINSERHAGPPPAAPPTGGPVPAPYIAYYSQVIEKVRTLPGIVSAAAVKDPPLRGLGERNGFRIPDRPVPAGQDAPSAMAIHVSDGYFRTIGARVDGREFAPSDRVGQPYVVVVNEAFAKRYFPGERAVGKRLLMGRDASVEIVGVVNDIRQVAMAEPAEPTLYLHNLQNSRVKTTIVARTAGEPLAMAEAVRQAIWSIDPDQAITAVFTFDDSVSRALARPRLLTVLLGAFGVLGLALGAVGLYGVLASLVGDQRREIGVRLALGAEPRQVQAMVIRRGLHLAAIGVAIGLAGALGLARFLGAVLYGVEPADPATLAGMVGLLGVTTLAASWLPARRAARLDPVETLRADL
jgi:predicted permease